MKNKGSDISSAGYSGTSINNVTTTTAAICNEPTIDVLPVPAFIAGFKHNNIICSNELFKKFTNGDKKNINELSWLHSNYKQLQNALIKNDLTNISVILKDNVGKDVTATLNARLINYDNKEDAILVTVSAREDVNDSQKSSQLEKANAELENLSKDFDEFTYIASHDLQEPLRKIITFSGRLSAVIGNDISSEAKVYLERMNVAADNMRGLISNLLDVSRAGKSSMQITNVALNDVVNYILRNLDKRIDETAAQITVDALPIVEGYRDQLEQLFCQLITNALLFKKAGVTPDIYISYKTLDAAEIQQNNLIDNIAYYAITIKDNGIGFEQQHAESIFKIFTRLNSKKEFAGSGCGLAIAKKIIEKHKGIIKVESTPEVGSLFTVIIPEKQV